jgi:MinD-like ATPase involved in chromosome partitioning or flagellar assembly
MPSTSPVVHFRIALGMPSQIITIARNAFAESTRQPLYLLLIALSGFLQIMSTWSTGFAMGYTESGEVSGDDKLLLELGLATVFAISVLLAGSGLVEYSRLTNDIREQLLNIIEKMKPRFDCIILDTGAGISDVVLFAVSLADDVMVVATPEPTSLTDAYATIKVLATQQGRRVIKLVVNQVARAGEGRTIRGQLQQVIDRYVSPMLGDENESLKLDLSGEVPIDPAVREAILKRQLLMEALPGSPAALGVGAVADKLLG